MSDLSKSSNPAALPFSTDASLEEITWALYRVYANGQDPDGLLGLLADTLDRTEPDRADEEIVRAEIELSDVVSDFIDMGPVLGIVPLAPVPMSAALQSYLHATIKRRLDDDKGIA